jgi:hypothetical protein
MSCRTAQVFPLEQFGQPLGIWAISASFSQERRYALARHAKSLRDFLHRHPLLVEDEGLCPTDASTEPIEHFRALRDELHEKRWRCGFDYLRIRQPLRVLSLDLGDSPLNQGEVLNIDVQDAIQVP